MNQSNWNGDFFLEPCSSGWRLRCADGMSVLLFHAAIDARHAGRRIERICVQWCENGAADVELHAGAETLKLHLQDVVAHRPLAGLYAALPLLSYDARSRRFWHRVFWLVRIPGGSALLRFVARRARAKT